MVFFTVQGQMLHWQDPLWRQIFGGTIFITAMEFITGIIVNKWMHLQVWDYTDQPFQLFGQICLPFALIFSGLCALGVSAVRVSSVLAVRRGKAKLYSLKRGRSVL